MSAIAERTENEVHYRDNRLTDTTGQISVSDATAHAACLTAKDVNASAIVTVSESGNTARLLSKYRPSQPSIACVMDEQVRAPAVRLLGHHPAHDGPRRQHR